MQKQEFHISPSKSAMQHLSASLLRGECKFCFPLLKQGQFNLLLSYRDLFFCPLRGLFPDVASYGAVLPLKSEGPLAVVCH